MQQPHASKHGTDITKDFNSTFLYQCKKYIFTKIRINFAYGKAENQIIIMLLDFLDYREINNNFS